MHDDLLYQAEALARLDARRPKQANLRRAISSAYYAVFHFLTHESTCALFGTQHSPAPYRHVIGRAFTHATMKQACVSFGGGNLKESVIKGLPHNPQGRYPVLQAIQTLAETFVELQEKRHFADYDRNERFKRDDALSLIEQAKREIASFESLPMSDDKRFFLACLWAWKDLTNR